MPPTIEEPAANVDATTASALPPTTSNVTTGGGTVNALPLWTTVTNIQSSALTQTGSGSTATSGKNSQSTTLTASAFNSSTQAAVSQDFRWQAEPSANNTSSPSGTLKLLFGSGSSTLSETGLHVANNGPITLASGQSFPAPGSVSSGGLSACYGLHGVSGSPVTGSGTLGLKWTVPPTQHEHGDCDCEAMCRAALARND